MANNEDNDRLISGNAGNFMLVRHGESEGNRERRFTISSEVGLTEPGLQQP